MLKNIINFNFKKSFVSKFFYCFFILYCFSISTNYANGIDPTPNNLAIEFKKTVLQSLNIPPEVVNIYIQNLKDAFRDSNLVVDTPQYAVLIDRNPNVQVGMIFWGGGNEAWRLIGAAPVSTGLPGTFDHFLTPLGVFKHSLDNLDFRAEGTKNELGFRGYGVKGMRVYDFGWVNQYQGWGSQKMSTMRLQMHSTDPLLAEGLLGKAKSKGCIRIPAEMNKLIDHYGLLDAEYEAAIMRGRNFWVLSKDRITTATPGNYLIVIDSGSEIRPEWAQFSKGRR